MSPGAAGAWPSCSDDLAALGAATTDCSPLSKPTRVDLPDMLVCSGACDTCQPAATLVVLPREGKPKIPWAVSVKSVSR